jgi:hypothetical protein
VNVESGNKKIILTGNFDIGSLDINGSVRLSVPTAAEGKDAAPATLKAGLQDELHRKLRRILSAEAPNGVSEIPSKDKLHEVMDLILTLPNQDFCLLWKNDHANLIATLPGGMQLTIALAVPAQAQFAVLQSFLPESLRSKLPNIESILGKSFFLNWEGSTSRFSFEFEEQQQFQLKGLKLKRGGFFRNIFCDVAEWILAGHTVVLPTVISGTVDLANASVNFDRATRFVIKLPFGLSKNLKIRSVSYDIERNEVDLGLTIYGKRNLPIQFKHI